MQTRIEWHVEEREKMYLYQIKQKYSRNKNSSVVEDDISRYEIVSRTPNGFYTKNSKGAHVYIISEKIGTVTVVPHVGKASEQHLHTIVDGISIEKAVEKASSIFQKFYEECDCKETNERKSKEEEIER